MGYLRYKRPRKRYERKPVFDTYDYVRIVNPTTVERVGYPLTPAMVLKELNTAANRQRVIDMLSDFDVPVGRRHYDIFDGTIDLTEVESVLRAISYHTVRIRNFGGPQRSLHTRELPHLKDVEVQILDKKTVRTGTRVPGYRVSEDEWESSYLENPKSHVLLKFWHEGDHWIESTNVIKV